MAILTANRIQRSYGLSHVLDGVDFSIHEGERVGLVGRNGSGKSTLARILAGLEAPDAGEVATRRGTRVEYLTQEPTFEGDPTAREAALSGLGAWRAARDAYDRASEALRCARDLEPLLEAQAAAGADVERLGGWDLDHRVDAILGHLGVTAVDQRVTSMSGGEQRRVALARLLVAAPDLAILDEPTNHLDADTVAWLEDYLAESFRGALILITHDRYLLDRVVTRTVELHDGRAEVYRGGWEAYLEAKAEREALAARTEAHRRNFLRTELEWLRRQPKARGTKQKARVDRALDAIASRPKATPRDLELRVQSLSSGGTILELEALCLEVAGRPLVSRLDLALTQGERIGIVGPNGAGKSTLLRAIAGQLEPTRGKIVRGARARIGYLAQTRSQLDLEATLAANLAGERREVDFHGRTLDLQTYAGLFQFESSRLRQPVSSLSGGERARVALARLLLEPVNVLLLDEPTNDLDVETLAALEDMLDSFPGVVLVVTHDRYFLDRVATAMLVFEGDGKVVRHAGGYSAYRERRETMSPPKRAEPATPASEKVARRPNRPRSGLTHAESKELESIVGDIERCEANVASLTNELADPSVYSDRGAEVPALIERLDVAKAKLDALMHRWEALESKREGSRGV